MDRVQRREPLDPWYRAARGVLLPGLRLTTRRRWSGQENVPAGGVIVAVNHISLVDPVLLGDFLMHSAGLVPRFMAKSHLFRGGGVVARAMRGTHQIPVDRDGSDAAASLQQAVAALHRGACVVIYPEGTTTRDPDLWPMRARTGVARLALLSGAPVLPVAQWGAARIHRRGRRTVRVFPPSIVHFRFGRPVDLSTYAGRADDADAVRAATEDIMNAITTELEELRGERRPAQVHDPRPGAGGSYDNRRNV